MTIDSLLDSAPGAEGYGSRVAFRQTDHQKCRVRCVCSRGGLFYQAKYVS